MRELPGLQIEQHETLQHVMIKDQIDVKILRFRADPLLPGDEGKTFPQLQQERLQIPDQRVLQARFQKLARVRQPQKLQ